MRRLVVLTALAALLLPAARVSASAGHLEGYVPAVAHASGQLNSRWTSDVWIYHQGATFIHLWYNPAGRDNTDVQSVVIQLDEPVLYLEDVVATVFGAAGFGSLHYLADGPVEVVSRTWTPREDGTGVYGQTIRGIPIGWASVAGTGQAGSLRVLVNQDGESRSNLGILNVSQYPVTVLVEIFTSDGEPAAGDSSFSVDLQPFDITQINDVLSRIPDGQGDGLIIRATVTSESGGIMAYVSTVNNVTNDPSYQEAFRFGF